MITLSQPRQNLLAAAGKIGEASQDVMDEVNETTQDMDKMFKVTITISTSANKSFI